MHKSQIHESVLKLGEDATFNARTVLEWVYYNKKLLPSLNRKVREKEKGAKAEKASVEGYIRMLNHYLRHGDWCSDFFGYRQELKTKWKVKTK